VDEDVVRLSSHLDAPWDSAVEGASGAALVLAQARYWVAQPVEQRPHRLVFVLHAGQFADGAGARRYVEDHPREQDRLVLHMVLEQAALEAEAQAGDAPVATERPAPRWFFTSRIPRLEQTVMEACTVEAVHRSMLLAPDAVPGQSPADGPYPYDEEVPLVHLRSLPHYIYDPGDTAELVDQEALAPLTRATVRIVASTSGVSANAMRSAEFSASG